MLGVFLVLYSLAVLCFILSATNSNIRVNLLAVGLALFTLVPLIQVARQLF